MNVPHTAVRKIVEAFNGKEEIGGCDGWLVTFPDHDSTQNAILLIGMLKGWTAEEHPHILHMIKIGATATPARPRSEQQCIDPFENTLINSSQ